MKPNEALRKSGVLFCEQKQEGDRVMDEQDRQEFQAQAEYGRKCQAAHEVLSEHITEQREQIMSRLETEALSDWELSSLVMYLRVLKVFSDTMKTKIDMGEVAEKELMRDGE